MSKKYGDDFVGDDNSLLWDLRKFYAFYVAEYLQKFKMYTEERNYKKMLDELEWLFATVKNKIKKYYTKEEFQTDKNKIIDFAKQYRLEWQGKKTSPEGNGHIDFQFLNLYGNIMDAMTESGIFGKGEDLSGL